MRAYFFGNMYLSSIQNGIQPQHCTSELFVKYREDGIDPAFDYLYEWAENHKTTIVLNGGYSASLRELIERFDSRENPYPWTYFTEDEDAIGPLRPTADGSGGALTAVCIVLPEKIYALSASLRSDDQLESYIRTHGEWGYDYNEAVEISKWELEFAIELNKYGLAS